MIDEVEVIVQAGKKESIIPIPEMLRKEIRAYIGKHLSGAVPGSMLIPEVFSDPNASYNSAKMTRKLSVAAKRAGIFSFGSQTPRKTFLYELYQETGNIEQVQEYINASSPAIAYRYLGVMPSTESEYKVKSAQENENSRYALLVGGKGADRIRKIIGFLHTLANEIDDPINSDAV